MKKIITSSFAVTAQVNGKDAFILDLTNQMNSVPVDANGNVTFATTVSTTARIIKGADYVREDIGLPTASDLKIGNVTPTITNDGGLVTIKWEFKTTHKLTEERYVKNIKMTHDGKTYNAEYTIRTDKSGAVYDLLPSMTEVPFVRDNDYNLIPASQTVYCGYTKNQNGTITTFDGKTASHLTGIDGKYYIYYRWVNAQGSFGSWTAMTKDGRSVSNSDTYAAIEFALSTASAAASVADGNIIDRETVPIVRQPERGFGIVTSVQRDNFTEAQWNTNPGYGVTGHEETWSDTSGIRNGARIGDLFTVVGKATDTGNGHTATYRCTNSSGNLKGICIAHQIARSGERNSTILLYKRSASAPSGNAAKPTGTLYYKFSDRKLYTNSGCTTAAAGTSTINGWSETIPENDGNPLYVIGATAYSSTDVDDIANTEWSSPVLYNKDGLHTAPVFLYKRSASSPSAAKPTATVYYKFADGKLYTSSALSTLATTTLNGWSQSIPETDGNPCWVIQATAVNTAQYDDIATSEWSSPIKMVEDGESSFIADLTNEADLFGTDSSGKTIGVQVRSTKMHLILGTKKQTLTANPTVSITYASNGNSVPTSVAQATSLTGKDTDEGSISITIKEAQTVTDSLYVDITSKCSTGSLTKRFTLKPVKGGENGKSPELWQLAPDVDNFSFERNDDGSLSPSSLTLHAYVEKTVGNDVTRYTSAQDGWRVYYGYDESAAEGYVAVGEAITLSNSTALSKRLVWLELRKSSDNYGGWVDRETVPINKDGKKGGNGDSGNGIKSITLYRMYTAAFSAPAASDSGWIVETNGSYPTPEGLSKDSNRYFLWQKKVTTYTKTSDVTNEISLVAQLNTGICANLLEDTAFNSIGEMDAWMTISQYEPSSLSPESGAGAVSNAAGPNGMNAYYDKTAYASSVLTYKEVLQQKIWENTSQGFKKLEYNKWYTLSFWVKGSAYTQLRTYIYPYCVNTSADFFVDGVKQSSVPEDGCVSWNCTTSWVRHSVTFKTRSSFYNSGYKDQYILFRLLPQGSSSNFVYICMPKLEQNYMATEWIEHTNDRKADDFQHIYVGEWAAGTTYHYDNGVRHVVRALESASGSKVYFRLKKRTTSAGLTSYTQPYNDSTNWEKANHLKFVATDLMLAEEVITDKLTVTKIRSANDKFIVDADGNVTANGGTYTNITAVNITANSGTIGGFTLSADGLTNITNASASSSNMAYIICRHDYYGRFAGIGANVLPASSGVAAVARFENTDQYGWGSENIAMILKARGKSGWGGITKNIACATYGGCFSGFALNVRIIDASSYAQTVTLGESDNVVTIIGSKEVNIYFPAVYRYDDGHVLIIKRDCDCTIKLHPGYYYDDSNNLRQTYLRYDRGDVIVGRSNYLSVESWGDSMMFIFHSNLQVTKDNTTYYGSWIQYKLPRNW